MKIQEINSIVIEGGGYKLFPVLGALDYLEEKQILKNIKYFSGSSAGMIIASLIACGYKVKDVKNIFESFRDLKPCFLSMIFNFVNKMGMVKFETVRNHLDSLISKKLKKNSLKGLYEERGITLVIPVSNLSAGKVEYIDKNTNIDLSLGTWVAISAAFPLFIEPNIIEQEYYVDSGLLDNFPVQLFNKERHITLGLKIEKKRERDINGLFSYIEVVINSLFHIIEDLRMENLEKNENRTVIEFQTKNKSVLSIDIDQEEIQKEYENGYKKIKSSL